MITKRNFVINAGDLPVPHAMMVAMAFHVFVEGATDATPAGVQRLALAIAKHYGLPAADLAARLQKGRFRVKGNIDRATAEQYSKDLQLLGARCTIEAASADNSQRATPLPFPAVRPATPVAGTPLVPRTDTTAHAGLPGGMSPARTATSAHTGVPGGAVPARTATTAHTGVPGGVAPARPATPPAGSSQYQSGLAAAFSNETPAASLGALEQDGLSFSLSSVDGNDEQTAAPPTAFEPPPDAAPKPKPKTPDKPDKTAKADRPKDEPLDLFIPPEEQGEEFKVDIAADEKEFSAKKQSSQPIPKQESEPAARKSQPSMAATPAPEVIAKPSKLGPLANERVRFAAGVVLAVLIGFLPAHLFASMREDSAYKAIDSKVMASQQLADTPEAYATLDSMRADQLDMKKGAQRNAAIIAFAIWALVGAGVAFAWFKKVPWDRLE